jgi:hypothetical protein
MTHLLRHPLTDSLRFHSLLTVRLIIRCRCCLTDNQPSVAMWGCCPYSPSPCTNQRMALHPDGTIRVGGNGNPPWDRCLTLTASPPPPPPPPPPIVTFAKYGAMDFKSYESTPLLFHGRLVLVETITLTYPGHMGHFDPAYASCSSYFRVRDLETGVVLRNLTESCDHSFGSAFVDTLIDGTEVLWIFGTSWYRPQNAAAGGVRGRGVNAVGWGGKCSADATCTVAGFRTVDPTFQTFTNTTVLTPGHSTWNVDVTTGRPGPDGSTIYIMAAEQHPRKGAPPGSVSSLLLDVKRRSWPIVPRHVHSFFHSRIPAPRPLF